MPSVLLRPLPKESIKARTGKRKSDTSRICVKCKTNTGNLVIRHSVYRKYVISRAC